MELDTPDYIKKLAEEGLTRIAMVELKNKGLRMDAIMYMSSALDKFANMDLNEIKKITFEIAMLGQKGLDINDPSIRHTLDSMEGDFQIHEKLHVDATVKIARATMPKHILKIKSNQGEYLSEMIAHECGHIVRTLSVTPPERKITCSTRLTFNQATAELDREKSKVSPELKSKMVEMWIHGLVLQITNLPVDARIERWIFETYPGLRSEQAEYLKKYSHTCISTFSPDIEQITPKKVFLSNMAMVFAFLTSIGLLIGEDYSQHFAPYPEIVQYGKVLVKLLEEPDRGYLQDIETTNYWAKILGLTNWFSWTDFENVPEGYGE